MDTTNKLVIKNEILKILKNNSDDIKLIKNTKGDWTFEIINSRIAKSLANSIKLKFIGDVEGEANFKSHDIVSTLKISKSFENKIKDILGKILSESNMTGINIDYNNNNKQFDIDATYYMSKKYLKNNEDIVPTKEDMTIGTSDNKLMNIYTEFINGIDVDTLVTSDESLLDSLTLKQANIIGIDDILLTKFNNFIVNMQDNCKLLNPMWSCGQSGKIFIKNENKKELNFDTNWKMRNDSEDKVEKQSLIEFDVLSNDFISYKIINFKETSHEG